MNVTSAPPMRACTTLTTNASKHHAVTSSTAAQVSAMTPMRVRWILRSVRMRASTGNAVTDIDTDQEEHGLESYVHIDRDSAARVGIAAVNIDNILYDAFGQRLKIKTGSSPFQPSDIS